MQFGLQLNSQHPMAENMRERLDELLDQVRLAQAVGFRSIVAPQQHLPAPLQMLQPLPLLAHMAAEADKMRLIAGILLLSLHNPLAPHPPGAVRRSRSRPGSMHVYAVSAAEISDIYRLGTIGSVTAGRQTQLAVRRAV